MKDKFFKWNDLFVVLWRGRLCFFVFFVLSVLFSFVYSVSALDKYKVYTVLEAKKIKHSSLLDIKIRLDNNTYDLPLSAHFGIPVESVPEYKANIIKYFMYPEIYIISSKEDVENNKEYLTFIQKQVIDFLLDSSAVDIKYPPYEELIANQEAQLESYTSQIEDSNRLLAIYDKQQKEAISMIEEYSDLMKVNGDEVDSEKDSFNKKCRAYIFKYISHANERDIALLPQYINATKKSVESLHVQKEALLKQKKRYEGLLEEIGGETGGTVITGTLSVKQPVIAEPIPVEWGKNFILFFFAMMFMAIGIVFFKEIVKE